MNKTDLMRNEYSHHHHHHSLLGLPYLGTAPSTCSNILPSVFSECHLQLCSDDMLWTAALILSNCFMSSDMTTCYLFVC